MLSLPCGKTADNCRRRRQLSALGVKTGKLVREYLLKCRGTCLDCVHCRDERAGGEGLGPCVHGDVAGIAKV